METNTQSTFNVFAGTIALMAGAGDIRGETLWDWFQQATKGMASLLRS